MATAAQTYSRGYAASGVSRSYNAPRHNASRTSSTRASRPASQMGGTRVASYDGYGNTARDYRQYSTAQSAPRRAPRHEGRPNVHVVPGKGASNLRLKPMNEYAPVLVKAALGLILIFAIVCGVRIWFSIATVEALEAVQSASDGIETARTVGNDLEITHSQLANQTRIETEAQALGMEYAKNAERITIEIPARFATHADGTLSISATVGNIEASIASRA